MKRCVLFPAGVLLGVLLLVGPVPAEDFPALGAKQLKAKIDANEKMFLWNPLSDIEFNEGYIPGSVNVPFHRAGGSDSLPKDKQTPVITYCLGPK